MAKKIGIYRQMLSIPMDLKKRMDKVADQVNWSAVAAHAFEVKLGEIAAKKEKKDMNDVIQRLRASKLEAEANWYKGGFEVGQKWAHDHGTLAQLKRLEAAHDEMRSRGEWNSFFAEYKDVPFSPGELLATLIEPIEHDRPAMTAFWCDVLGDSDERYHDSDFARGFAEGVVDFWLLVKDSI